MADQGSLGAYLRGLRLAAGLTQEQLALAMDTSQSYIARVERGTTTPGLDVLQRWAGALGYTKLGLDFRQPAS